MQALSHGIRIHQCPTGKVLVETVLHVSTDEHEPDYTFKLNKGETRTFRKGGVLEVAVTDTGAGMNKEQLATVFQDGVQFNKNSLQAGQGSGLGLYIAQGIMKQHGGSLTVDSNGIGLGTTFTMILPLYRVPREELDLESKRGAASHKSGVAGVDDDLLIEPLRVLVVDDSAMNRKLLVRLLQNQGHTCDQAENGLAAVDKVKEALANDKPYDSILMDNLMPEMNGPDAAKEIRALGSDSFIIGITGNLFEEDVLHYKDCGANKVLAKPVKLQELTDGWYEYGVGTPPIV